MKAYALFIGLLSAALFGSATPLSKTLLASVNALQLAGLLYLGAGAGLLPFMFSWKSRAVKLDRLNSLYIAGAVIFGGILGPVFLLWGLTFASSASVSLWLNLELFATALLGHFFFRDQLGQKGWIAVAAGFSAGVLLTFNEPGTGILAGMLVAAACLCWGLDNHFTALIDGITPMQSTLIKGFAAGTVNFTLGCLAAGTMPQGPIVLKALLAGALAYGLSIMLYITAAQAIGAVRSQIVFSTAPFWGLLFSVLFLHESISLIQVAALLVLVLSIVLILTESHEHGHSHTGQDHVHVHRHDDSHHFHGHEGESPSLTHAHFHHHEALSHSHRHLPDLHHRHRHADQ
ncbi:MAG: EamA family transporter [Candidatus Eremiobacteraeota bacterium]|nr:EamA family transporter [Candidatus Eremiobacteraeota bacterium]